MSIDSDESPPQPIDESLDGDASEPRPEVWDHWIFGEDPLWGLLGVAITAMFVLYYFFHIGHLTSDIHRGYGDSAFDIGLYDQGVWLMSRFHAPYVTEMGRNLFGDHTQFQMITMVPLYWVRPDATTLLWVQAALMAAGAIPVYLLTMRRLQNPLFATVLAGAFLLHPALALTNLENFHPDAFLVPILGFAIYAAIENKPRMFVAFSIAALLCKEDIVLLILPLAIWFAFRRNRRLGAVLAGSSVFYAFFATYGVMKSLIGVPTLNTGRIPFDGFSGLLKEMFQRPANVIKYVIKSENPNGRPFYVWQMIAPTGLVFFISPEIAATTILVIASNVISNFGYQHIIAYHYSMVILPGMAMGTVYAIAKLKTERVRSIAVAVVGLSALWTGYLWGPFPFALHHDIPHWSPAYPAVAAINEVKDKLPPNAVVSAYYSFVPHIDHRTQIYMWPTPFRAVYWNTFKQEGQRLPQADKVEYLMLPPDLEDHNDVFASIKNQFEIVAQSSNAILYKRIHP